MSSTGTYPITGIPVDQGQDIPKRHEITAWSQNPLNVWEVSLFIRALRFFQDMPWDGDDGLKSYFQIAGIHQLPDQPWDTSEPKSPKSYCSHNEITFPTWHRPYVLLFEQRIWEIMTEEIIDKSDEIPDGMKPFWRQAANKWRLPYWDSAVIQSDTGKYGVPGIVDQPKIQVTSLKATLEHPFLKDELDNPLYKYTLKTKDGTTMGDESVMKGFAIQVSGLDWVAECRATSRHGITKNKDITQEMADGIEANNLVSEAIEDGPIDMKDGHPISISEAVYRLLSESYFKSWKTFSTKKYAQPPEATEWLSLETVHDNIHDWTGGSLFENGVGHMALPQVAAFDPIFWLHHCNVDRLLAIWQSLNSDKWFDPGEGDPTSDAHLKPFHTDQEANYFDSDLVRDWTKYGYTYDLIVPSPGSNDVPARKDIYRKINNTYGHLRRRLLGSANDLKGSGNDYIINVLYNRYALDGELYVIHFFVGEVPAETKDFASSPNHLGIVNTFSSRFEVESGGSSGCSNCKSQAEKGILSKGQIIATNKMLRLATDPSFGRLKSLLPQEVKDLLTNDLHWRIVNMKGELLPTGQFSDLKVFALSGKAIHSDNDDELSLYHDYAPMWEVTHGKLGGAQPSDSHRLNLGS